MLALFFGWLVLVNPMAASAGWHAAVFGGLGLKLLAILVCG